MSTFNPGERLTSFVSTAELERRWAVARDIMHEHNVDILIMRASEEYLGGYVRWFTDLPVRHTFPLLVIFPRDDEMTLVAQGPCPHEPPAPVIPPDFAVRGVKERLNMPFLESANWSMPEEARLALRVLQKTPAARIGWVGFHFIPAALYLEITKNMPHAHFCDLTDAFDAAKAAKSPEEQELVRAACRLQDEVYARLPEFIKPGKREYEIYNDVHHLAGQLGSERGLVLVGSAPKGKPGPWNARRYENRMLREGDMVSVLVEVSGPGGMYAELNRPISLGEPDQEQIDAFGIALEAQCVSLNLLKSGALPQDVLAETNRFLTARGYAPELRIYAHGQGYDLVERPMFQNGEPMRIARDMNIAVHPTAANTRVWMNICDNYLIGPDGPGECLHTTAKEIIVLR